MKLIIAVGCWLLAVGWVLQSGGELQISVNNIHPMEGELYVAVYDNEDAYMDIEKAAFQKIVAIKSETEHFVIEGVPDGEFAIAIFQDLNGNGKLDTSKKGIPKEPFGFSNDARGSFGPPKFKKAKFIVSGNTEIMITLVNNEKK